MSVFADILVLAALIAAAWLGARRGLLKSLAGLLIVVVALLGASWAADHLSEPVTRWIEPRVTQRVEQKIEESHAVDAGQMLQALSFRGDSLQKLLDTVSQRVQETGESLIRAVSLSVARSVASTAVYVVSFLVLLALLWLLVTPAQASVIPDSVTEALPPEAAAHLEGLDETPDHTTWSEGLARLWHDTQQQLGEALREKASGAALLLGVVLLCGVAESFFTAAEQPSVPRFVPMAGALAITLTAAGDLQQMMGLGVETMEELDVFAKALLPTLSAAAAASGGAITAGTRQVATVFFANLLLSVIRKLLLPLLYCCIAAASADTMAPDHGLKKIGAGISKAVTWALTATMVVFTGFLTLTGAATGAADAMTVQMTRSAIATAVPVVGSIISEATGTVLAGAGVLKNAVGIFGMLAVLAICLTPFLNMAVQYLLYKLAAFLAGTVTEEPLAELIDALGSAFGLMLGMTGSCALALLISIISSVSVVSG